MKDRIKSLRTKKNITQAQLGQVLGVGQKAVSMIENGINKPTVQQLEALSRFFDVSIDYMVTGLDVKVTPAERELLSLIKEDSGLYKSLMDMLKAKKNLMNRLAA